MGRKKQLNIALVGIGDHMNEHLLPALRLIDGIKIVGAVSRSATKRDSLGSLDNNIRVFSSIDDLLRADIGVQVVVCAGPPDYQGEVIRKSIKFGCSAFVEKPTCIDCAELKKLQEQAEADGLIIFTGYNFTYSEIFQEYQSNKEPSSRLHEEIRFYSNKPKESIWGIESVEGAFLYAVGIHAISLAYARLNGPFNIAKISLKKKNNLFRGLVSVENNSGEIDLKFTNAYPYFDWGMEYWSTNGRIIKTDGFSRLLVLKTQDQTRFKEMVVQNTYPGLKTNANSIGYINELTFMLDTVRAGDMDSIKKIHERDLFVLCVCRDIVNGMI